VSGIPLLVRMPSSISIESGHEGEPLYLPLARSENGQFFCVRFFFSGGMGAPPATPTSGNGGAATPPTDCRKRRSDYVLGTYSMTSGTKKDESDRAAVVEVLLSGGGIKIGVA
jgi:hypothetical protein